ncbi:SDR family NAD(P)-dependent oxidoreductase [Neptuniibacter sp. SY11_33]|uniref:SDR family NAD(P)-dependent oxidoreductase n=1 Tax=Neptuniibacter sp. SY11_33 TaxID=3398215 RepID=UPI0039F63ECF
MVVHRGFIHLLRQNPLIGSGVLVVLVCMNSVNNRHKNVVLIGATGGIGSALIKHLLQDSDVGHIFAFSRLSAEKPIELCNDKVTYGYLDLYSEKSISQLGVLLENVELDLVLVCSGLLHDDQTQPEKRLSQVNMENFQKLFHINATAPMLIAQQLVPLLNKKRKVVFAVISARVGSISDNRLGGWYGYRASKSALNMLLKTLSIEIQRKLPQSIIVGLHPGTVNTMLSQPFQSKVPADKLFSPEQSTSYLLDVIEGLRPEQSGRIFAWDGAEILP